MCQYVYIFSSASCFPGFDNVDEWNGFCGEFVIENPLTIEIARLMFDPKALAEEAQKPQHQRKIAEILRKSKQDKSGQSIVGYLGGKLKEKGGFAWGDLSYKEK